MAHEHEYAFKDLRDNLKHQQDKADDEADPDRPNHRVQTDWPERRSFS